MPKGIKGFQKGNKINLGNKNPKWKGGISLNKKEYQKKWREENKERQKENNRKYYLSHKERIRKYFRKYRRKNKKRIKKWHKKYNQEKLKSIGNKCEKCGMTDERVLVVHHKTPRDKKKKYWAIKEKDNLIMVCANCHAIIHWELKQQKIS